jgi:hypothetical protein
MKSGKILDFSAYMNTDIIVCMSLETKERLLDGTLFGDSTCDIKSNLLYFHKVDLNWSK